MLVYHIEVEIMILFLSCIQYYNFSHKCLVRNKCDFHISHILGHDNRLRFITDIFHFQCITDTGGQSEMAFQICYGS